MKRGEHTFQFSGSAISNAAKAEFDYHSMRTAFWRDQHGKAVDAAKAKGVEMREFAVTGGTRAELVLDPTLQTRINECASKINSHRAAADRFQIEAAAYATQADRSYELHPDDVVYFRLAGGPREE
jgi:hypothetical protein